MNDQRFPTLADAPLTLGDDDPEDMLAAGTLDVYISPRTRDLLKPPAERQFRPIFRDVHQVERDYYARTGIYPINHTVVVRNEVLEQFPDAPRAIFDA